LLARRADPPLAFLPLCKLLLLTGHFNAAFSSLILGLAITPCLGGGVISRADVDGTIREGVFHVENPRVECPSLLRWV